MVFDNPTSGHLEYHHVPTTQLRIEILHRIWYLDGKLCPNDRPATCKFPAAVIFLFYRCNVQCTIQYKHAPLPTASNDDHKRVCVGLCQDRQNLHHRVYQYHSILTNSIKFKEQTVKQ